MQEAHQLARERDRKEVERLKKSFEMECRTEVNKEVKKMKEILGQEYDFKVKSMTESM